MQEVYLDWRNADVDLRKHGGASGLHVSQLRKQKTNSVDSQRLLSAVFFSSQKVTTRIRPLYCRLQLIIPSCLSNKCGPETALDNAFSNKSTWF